MDCDKYREYGDLLFAYMGSIERRETVTLPSFETGKDIHIPLDMRFDIKGNANRYYQKYHKSKRAQAILQEQLALCEKEIRYFESMEVQLEQATVQDAMEIREELARQGYVKAVKTCIRKKKRSRSFHIMRPLHSMTYISMLVKTICKMITLPGVWEKKAICGCIPRMCMEPGVVITL